MPVEASAAPDHDWNARITRECYQPLLRARVGEGPAARYLNTYEWLSFNVGPTLLDWMEREARALYHAILAADAASAARLGHGNAVAMPYHHVILPLCSRRDKVTEVRWGLADFRRRFGREAAGLWLPETAVDDETLEVLADEGVAFTILAPHQVPRPPAGGLPGRYRSSRGREIALFLYDGAISHDVAFGPLIADSVAWERRLFATPDAELVSVATDGETYGHHHVFGELALAALLDRLARHPVARVENYAAFLARRPATEQVPLVVPSSWSCAHGVERWRSDCGCRIEPGSQQRWREPLRRAVAWLTGEVHALYQASWDPAAGECWHARDASGGAADPAPKDRATALLEMERSVLRAHTSCGWFFDDFAALEGRIVLRYAARAMLLAGAERPRLEAGFLERLGPMRSNDPAMGTGPDVFREVRPA